MSWRTVVISGRCKLDFKMGYLVVRAEETKRVFMDEIALLLIENTAVSLTGFLVAELVRRKIKVIFCDERRNPAAELSAYYGCHDCTQKLRLQLAWDSHVKGEVWTAIIVQKIKMQQQLLREQEKDVATDLLADYLAQMQFYDKSNREGHAAKVYFNALFGNGFSRGDATNATNAALNYGYSLILSAVNREIVANGYLTQLGLFHDNVFNPFNLGCDLMEPLRVFIDRYVYRQIYTCFETSHKHALLSILQQQVQIADTHQVLLHAIKLYVHSVFDALNQGDCSCITFATPL